MQNKPLFPDNFAIVKVDCPWCGTSESVRFISFSEIIIPCRDCGKAFAVNIAGQVAKIRK